MGWLIHAIRWTYGPGYNIVSGPVADIPELAILGWLVTHLRQRNCHVNRCWRLAWHQHPANGHPVCRHHHPHHRSCTDKGAAGAAISEIGDT